MSKNNKHKLIASKKILLILISLLFLSLLLINKAQLFNTFLPMSVEKIPMKVYYEKKSGWKMSYPADMKVVSSPVKERVIDPDAIGNAVDFWIYGPTQNEGTEFHDGLFITIFTANKNPDTNLKEFADQKSKYNQGNSTYPVTRLLANGISGYQFLNPEYGRTLNIFLPYEDREDKVLIMYIVSEGKYKNNYDNIYKNMLE